MLQLQLELFFELSDALFPVSPVYLVRQSFSLVVLSVATIWVFDEMCVSVTACVVIGISAVVWSDVRRT